MSESIYAVLAGTMIIAAACSAGYAYQARRSAERANHDAERAWRAACIAEETARSHDESPPPCKAGATYLK
jgi:hypothetical protein